MRRLLGCCGALAALILTVQLVAQLAEEPPAARALQPPPAFDLLVEPQSTDCVLVPIPEPASLYERWLQSFGAGVTIVEVSTAHCPPCLIARRDLVPWLERGGWRVEMCDDHGFFERDGERQRLGDLLQADAYPVFLYVENGREIGRYVGSNRDELAAFLRSCKGQGQSLEALGVALAAHVGQGFRDDGARASSLVPYRAFGPPPVRVADLLAECAGQTLALGDVATLTLSDLAWTPQRLPDAIRLQFTTPPTLALKRWVFWTVTLDALVVRLESVTAELGGFPDFTVPVEWD